MAWTSDSSVARRASELDHLFAEREAPRIELFFELHVATDGIAQPLEADRVLHQCVEAAADRQ